ncbi:hypothetical protein HCN44_005233 [Aphidius gifuensis]|uniref:BHLH domain-containing protein n=1 Tax=Aphidius gifuensis TaxID=684658 RepID=A0A834XXC2_APHGI|nr:hypothetical protein HCN44_005233 [Aphidius gifuensis]
MMSYDYPHPASRTYQYKKVTKPLLERKRRARINRCLDELKDLMVEALETEGENISKLEKADILELTVRHLQRIHGSQPSLSSPSIVVPPQDIATAESRWKSGFGHCATEACRYLASLPDESGERLARHLASGLQSTRNINVIPQPRTVSPIILNSNRICESINNSPRLANECQMSRPLSSLPFNNQRIAPPSPMSPPNSEYSYAFDNQSPSNYVMRKRNRTNSTRHHHHQANNENIDIERANYRNLMWRPW